MPRRRNKVEKLLSLLLSRFWAGFCPAPQGAVGFGGAGGIWEMLVLLLPPPRNKTETWSVGEHLGHADGPPGAVGVGGRRCQVGKAVRSRSAVSSPFCLVLGRGLAAPRWVGRAREKPRGEEGAGMLAGMQSVGPRWDPGSAPSPGPIKEKIDLKPRRGRRRPTPAPPAVPPAFPASTGLWGPIPGRCGGSLWLLGRLLQPGPPGEQRRRP